MCIRDRNIAVHVALVLVPIKTMKAAGSKGRRGSVTITDRQGFTVPRAAEEWYNAQVGANAATEAKLLQRWQAQELAQWNAAGQDGGAPGEHAQSMLHQQAVSDGIPDMVRGHAWQLLCGSAREAADSPGFYSEILHSAQMEGTPWITDIAQDIERTFPDHAMLSQSKGREELHHVLLATSKHRPEIGYCQSMNFLAAWLLLKMEEESAFWTLDAIISRILEGFYSHDMMQCQLNQLLLQDLMTELQPVLAEHLLQIGIKTTTFAMRWFLCLYIGILPSDTTLRVWDLIMCHGRPVLFRVALTLLARMSQQLLNCRSFEDSFEVLKQSPQREFDPNDLIEAAMSERHFSQTVYDRLVADRHQHYLDQVVSPPGSPVPTPTSNEPDAHSQLEMVQRIQALIVGHHVRRDYAGEGLAATRIQSLVRQFLAKRSLQSLLHAKWEHHMHEVLGCWRDLHVSLIRRSEFWQNTCACPRLGGLRALKTEARKLRARRGKLRKNHPGVALHACQEVQAADQNLVEERAFLKGKIDELVDGDEFEQLCECWGVEKLSREEATVKISDLVWSHGSAVWRSASTVQWLMAGDAPCKTHALRRPSQSDATRHGFGCGGTVASLVHAASEDSVRTQVLGRHPAEPAPSRNSSARGAVSMV
eukprot:TRINITY_DN4636_c0_g1_i2.p1 TRINITY_DN4636_c0_g1~~TRINITY_DN4636_c0_g1_i2.p1  ORF type:complete len:648 (-),score=143.21 TRINITY_DN4636_c0_g1_i2:282-2225(-)